jgi:hypothetical protein
VKVQPVRIGKRSYEELTIKAEDAGAAGLAAMIESRADMEKVLHIVIEGARRPGYPDMEEVVAPLADSFFHISLTDRSWAAPSTLEPVAYPEGSPARIYLQALQDMIGGASESEKDEITDAMQIGLAMLLGRRRHRVRSRLEPHPRAERVGQVHHSAGAAGRDVREGWRLHR